MDSLISYEFSVALFKRQDLASVTESGYEEDFPYLHFVLFVLSELPLDGIPLYKRNRFLLKIAHNNEYLEGLRPMTSTSYLIKVFHNHLKAAFSDMDMIRLGDEYPRKEAV